VIRKLVKIGDISPVYPFFIKLGKARCREEVDCLKIKSINREVSPPARRRAKTKRSKKTEGRGFGGVVVQSA